MKKFSKVLKAIFVLLVVFMSGLCLGISNNYILKRYNGSNQKGSISKTLLSSKDFSLNLKKDSITKRLFDYKIGLDSKESSNYISLFNFVLDKIQRDYVESVESKKLYEAAIDGMLSSLDPHSSYLNKEDFDDMQVSMKGEFTGLGIEITKEFSLIKIIAPIEGTPAYKAGLKSGDYISQINGKSVIEMSLNEAVKMMRGKIGETVRLTILRNGEAEPLEFGITRDVISQKCIRSKRYSDVIYIKIISFTEKVYQEFLKSLVNLTKEIGEKNIKGIVIDLRGNPGGLLDQSLKIAELFLTNDKKIVTIKGRDNKVLEAYKSHNNKPFLKNVPMVVLINEGSASASEIVVGALQDNKRAVVLGTKSFGKASVQSVMQVPMGGAIKMTIARYYTPLGRSIQADGIEPDIVVENNEIRIVNNKISKFALKEKDLKGHLENTKDDIVSKNISQNIKKEHDKNLNVYQEDYQLGRALDLIMGIGVWANLTSVE